MKPLAELAYHGHAQLAFSGQYLAYTAGRSQEGYEVAARQTVLIHQLGEQVGE